VVLVLLGRSHWNGLLLVVVVDDSSVPGAGSSPSSPLVPDSDGSPDTDSDTLGVVDE
jgi:hypothetical protein